MNDDNDMDINKFEDVLDTYINGEYLNVYGDLINRVLSEHGTIGPERKEMAKYNFSEDEYDTMVNSIISENEFLQYIVDNKENGIDAIIQTAILNKMITNVLAGHLSLLIEKYKRDIKNIKL